MSNSDINISSINFEEPLVAGFVKSVSVYPDKNALWVNERYYTYKELWQLVYSIYLQIPSDKKTERIGIYCNDDAATYASILAVNLYGAAYVPLNNKFPAARNKNIVEQCGLKLILSSLKNEALKEIAGAGNIIYTNTIRSEVIAPVPETIISLKKADQSVAYILFTSGSTGEPKGVPVLHLNVNHFFNFFLKNYDFNPEDRFLQVYELTFDVSVFSFFMPLYAGACCYILPDKGIRFVKILQMLEEHRITVVSMVPTVLRYIKKYLDEIQLPSLRYSFFSGDALYHELAAAWSRALPNAAIHNFYGPTETTIVCTQYIWKEEVSEKESVNGIVPLGKPFEEMKTLIIDENDQPSEKGALCFSGVQVIPGYLNDLNEKQFFNFQDNRFYKTGDIVSCNENNNLVFYGRADRQIKMNGYRVELDEIELVIEKIIRSKAVVVFKEEKLVAFIEIPQLDAAILKDQLMLLLPDYMIPQKIICIDHLPLTINGKVDNNKLLKLQEQL